MTVCWIHVLRVGGHYHLMLMGYEESMPVGEFISSKQRRSMTRPHRKRREKQQGDYHVLISSDSV